MKKYSPLPPAEKLRELFSYDKETGDLRWKVKRNGVNEDMIAGALSCGYVVVRIDGKLFRAHRIIWKLVTGEDPLDQIDHKDLDRSNNRWENLRPADNSKNMMNAGLSRANKSGIKGVFWDTHANGWRARIKIHQKAHHIGLFHNLDDAGKAIRSARNRLHGDFARTA